MVRPVTGRAASQYLMLFRNTYSVTRETHHCVVRTLLIHNGCVTVHVP